MWWRRALQQRLGTLAATGLLLWTAATALAASVATERITAAIRSERETRARGIASRIDLALEDDLRQLDLIAASAISARASASLAAHVRGLRLAESVVRLSPDGDVVWARSVADGAPTAPILSRIPPPAQGQWRAEPTALLPTSRGSRAFLVLPARESDPAGGAVAEAIDPDTSALRALLASYAEEPYRVEVVDERDAEIGASRAAGGAPRNGDALLSAEASIASGTWRVRLAQPRDEAIAPVLALRRVLVGSSLLLFPFAVLVALATARSIRRPVLAMTAAAEQLARGDVSAPIPPAGEDEIGRLSAALEQLRRTLEADGRRSLLLKRVISAQEEERRRIARELHDETTQQLTALAMQIQSVAGSHPETSPLLAGSRDLVRTMIDDLHRVIYDLRPSMLDDLGLLPAIRSYAETHLASRGIEVHCELPGALPPISRDATTALYRVVQEALTNVARHARAETVFIGCEIAGGRIVMEIEDDGAGFDPDRAMQPKDTGEGLGLLGMRERLALLGGALDIESEPGRGTRVIAVLPLGGAAEGREA